MPKTKVCTKCKKRRRVSRFFSISKTKNRSGLASWCKTCHAEWKKAHYEKHPEHKRTKHLRRNYGIDEADYQVLVECQEGLCRICKEPSKVLCVDHCHTRNSIRGLLCKGCNTAIGFFKEDPERCRAAAEYLERTDPKQKPSFDGGLF